MGGHGNQSPNNHIVGVEGWRKLTTLLTFGVSMRPPREMAHCNGRFSVKNQARDLVFFSDCRGDQGLSTGPIFSTIWPKFDIFWAPQKRANIVKSCPACVAADMVATDFFSTHFFTHMRSFGSRELTDTLKRIFSLLFRGGYFRANHP